MRKQLQAAAALCALASGGLSAPSFASPVTVYVTYTGTMTGTDVLGDFGQPNSPLSRVPYTANYVFDVDYSLNTTVKVGNGTSSPGTNQLDGGSGFIPPSDTPGISGSFTVGSATFSTNGSIDGNIAGSNDGTHSDQFHRMWGSLIIENFIFAGSAALTASIETAFSYTSNPLTDVTGGSFCEGVTGFGSGMDCINLKPETITVSLTPPSVAVPEPSALAIFFAGLFGMVALRHGRLVTAFAGLGLLHLRRKRMQAA